MIKGRNWNDAFNAVTDWINLAVTQNAQQFLELLERLKITRLVLVPSLLKALLTYVSSRRRHATRDAPAGAVPLKHLKLWVCSGEILPADLLIQFYECFPQDTVICNFYGSTEVMGDVTAAIFKSLHDVRSSLVDNKVPIGSTFSYSTYSLHARFNSNLLWWKCWVNWQSAIFPDQFPVSVIE